MKIKRTIRIAFVFLVILTLAVFAIACDRNNSKEFKYAIIDYNKKIVAITGIKDPYASTIVIPESINGYTVTSIDDYVFSNNPYIETVYLPKTIEYMGRGAFYKCEYLTSVYGLEECTNMTEIAQDTFFGCASLSHILLPEGLVSIKQGAFKSCWTMPTINIPESVEYIGKYAFDNCQSIEQIVIPSRVTVIEEGTFFGCLALKDVVLHDQITSIGAIAFTNCYSLERITLPSSLIFMGSDIFNNCGQLLEVVVPSGVKAINSRAFVACISLTNISLPASIESISFDAFDYCNSLVNVSIDESNPRYYSDNGVIYDKKENMIFRYSMGKTGESFTIPDGIEIIGFGSFAGVDSSLKYLIIPSSVKEVKDYAFYSSCIEQIYYQGTVEEWTSISKDSLWNEKTMDYTIYCTDGEIAKDGTVTYK